MRDDAVLCHQFRHRDTPLVGRGQQEPLAGFSAGELQIIAALAHIPARIVTVSSGAIVIQALISGTVASRYQGVGATGTFAACAPGGIQKPRTIAPPTAAVVVRNSRRSMSVLFSDVFSLMVSSLTTQRGRAMDGLADAMVCSAAAGVGHLSIDIRVRRFRFLF